MNKFSWAVLLGILNRNWLYIGGTEDIQDGRQVDIVFFFMDLQVDSKTAEHGRGKTQEFAALVGLLDLD